MCSLFFRQISQQERGACVIPFCFWYFWQTFVSSYLQFSSLSTVETNSLKDLIKFIQRRIKLSLKSAGPSEFEGGHDFKPYSATRFKRIYLWGIGLHSFIYSEQKKGLKIKRKTRRVKEEVQYTDRNVGDGACGQDQHWFMTCPGFCWLLMSGPRGLCPTLPFANSWLARILLLSV